jgi:sugar O-acyltransferase (sialic acid O-acetyltransferase NeuD family)
MIDMILAGSGGCMRELVWQMQEMNQEKDSYHILGYVDREKPEDGIGVMVGNQRISYLGDDEFLLQRKIETNVAICVGTPALRKRIAQKLKQNPRLHFPSLILKQTAVCPDVVMGEGCIISRDCRISTNVRMGDFIFLNLAAGICHDGTLGDYVTLSPDVRLAGNVTVGCGSDLGLGTKVIQGVRIGENVRTGAGAIVVTDLPDGCTAVGVPAKVIK